MSILKKEDAEILKQHEKEDQWINPQEWKFQKNWEKEMIEKIKADPNYQAMHDVILEKLNKALQEEFQKRGADTNSYLPKEWEDLKKK